MGYLLTGPGDRNLSLELADTLVTPMNENGDPFAYCLVMPDGEDYLYADTYDDMLVNLIPGYLATDDLEERALMRMRLGTQVAVVKQAEILADLDPAMITDEDWQVLTAPKAGSQVTSPEWWNSPIPLIVVETSYVPYTDIPRPASGLNDGIVAENLWWIRPAEQEDFLLSLHEVGFVQLMENLNMQQYNY